MALFTNYPARNPSLTTDVDPSTKIELKCLARSTDFQRKLGDRFVLPEHVREPPWVVTASSVPRHHLTHRAPIQITSTAITHPESILLNLPYEVLLVIFGSFDHVSGQIAFALTCKKLALIARDVNLTLSLTSKKYAGFLPVAVFGTSQFVTVLHGNSTVIRRRSINEAAILIAPLMLPVLSVD
jgi:hypothetical protein